MDVNELNDLLSRNLESLMAEKGLNPSGWAKAAGLGHTGVRDIIQKKVKSPTYKTLLNLAKVAKVDVRRITVGPDYLEIDESDAELLDLFSQLQQPDRDFLLNAAKAQIAARKRSREQSPSEDE